MTTLKSIIASHLGIAALGGLIAGGAWLALTPSGEVVPQRGYLYSIADDEMIARQDGVFLLCIAVVAICHTVWFLTWKQRVPTLRWRFLAGMVAAFLGTAIAWAVGYYGGPAQLPLSPGNGQRFPAPLNVHARAILLTWPFIFAFATCLRWSVWDVARLFRRTEKKATPDQTVATTPGS